jgi:hypothetical protein
MLFMQFEMIDLHLMIMIMMIMMMMMMMMNFSYQLIYAAIHLKLKHDVFFFKKLFLLF